MNDFFVILQADTGLIAKIENQEIYIDGNIDIPFDSSTVITKNDPIVSLCHYSKLDWFHNTKRFDVIKVFDMTGNLLTEKRHQVSCNCSKT